MIAGISVNCCDLDRTVHTSEITDPICMEVEIQCYFRAMNGNNLGELCRVQRVD